MSLSKHTANSPGLEPMEVLGSLMSRMLHDLSNQLTILGGNAQLLELVANNPAKLVQVTDRIKKSADAAGKLLDDYARFRQSFTFPLDRTPVTELVDGLRQANPLPDDWVVLPTGDGEREVRMEARWLAYLVWQSALLGGGRSGEVVVSAGPFPADWRHAGHVPGDLKTRELLRVVLSWESETPWMSAEEATKPVELFAASVYEIAKLFSGWLHYQHSPDLQNRFTLFFPAD